MIVFDNAGVGRSTGQTPDNVAAMARDAFTFINLLGLSKVDLLGFSLGGFLAPIDRGSARTSGPQANPRRHCSERRRRASAGGAPGGVLTPPKRRCPAAAVLHEIFRQPSAGLAFLKRAKARTEDRDADSGKAVTDPQAKALITWCATPDPEHAILRGITQPALVASGSNDTMLPADNAYAMFKALSNAQLILYPDSGHGALFQHHEAFVSHVRTSSMRSR